jgi:ankyrin repeat protein
MASNPALSSDIVKDFVIAAHFDLAKVQAMLAENPALLTVEHQWGENDFEDGLGAASHMGNRAIAEYFLAQGAPLTICAAAMLGRLDDVTGFLDADSSLANARGAHQITVMFHTAMSGSIEIAELLKSHGCTEGFSYSLHGAIEFGHKPMAEWLLNNGVQLINALNFEGKTPLKKALELGHSEIAELIRAYGGTEEAEKS